MDFALKRLSIVDITHHADIASATGKVTFQFADALSDAASLDQFIVVDVAIAAADNDTMAHLQQTMLAKALEVLQCAVLLADGVPPRELAAGTVKLH